MLQVMQRLSSVIEATVWRRRECNSGNTDTAHVQTAQILASILTLLLTVLVDVSVPRDARVGVVTVVE